MPVFPPLPFNISVPPLPLAPLPVRALQARTSAPLGTPIGGVQIQIAQIGASYPTPELDLTFNQFNAFALQYHQAASILGASAGSTLTLNSSALTAGWLLGHNVIDPMGVLQLGTFVTAIDPTGLSVTVSQPVLRNLSGVPFTAFGTNLVTNWSASPGVGELVGELQASSNGYVTSYFQFLVTIT